MIAAGSHSWAQPSLEAQADALTKGLGRAYQWAHAGLLSQEALLRACLQSRRHDLLFGEPKGEWLFGLVELLDAGAALRDRLMAALEGMSDADDFPLLCDLAGRFARAGDTGFKKALYQIVERKPIEPFPWLGEKEIVALDGEIGFRFALEARIEKFGPEDWIWDGQELMECGRSQLGDDSVTRVCECLDKGSGTYLEEINRLVRAKEVGPVLSQAARTARADWDGKQLTPRDLIDIAELEGLYSLFHRWGEHATPQEREAMQNLAMTADHPVAQANYLAVFAGRGLVVFDERLIERCRHRDPRVQDMAFRVLEHHDHPLVGKFAREGWSASGIDCRFLRLFIKNFQPGDEERIRGLPTSTDDWAMERHCQAILLILESHPGYHCFELGLPVYAAAPCEAMRYRAANLLHRLNLAPKWLLEECRFDSHRPCRVLAHPTAERPRNQRITIGITSVPPAGHLPIGAEVPLRGYAV